MAAGVYIGLMSGTSLDGVDGVIARLGDGKAELRLLAHCHQPFEPGLRSSLLALNSTGHDELHLSALAGNALALAYGDVVQRLLSLTSTAAEAVNTIGAHGQTVRHRPGEFDGKGYTIQLLNGALLAELTGIDVVCDFRTRDVAAGGQGAPLVPAFHHAMFHELGIDRAVLNIGGIANLTLLHADGRVGGFDCGPGNVLMDLWTNRCTGQPYDAGGEWAASGNVNHALLHRMLADEYLRRSPPKSTGRDHFHAVWLDAHLASTSQLPDATSDRDIQATLTRLTARAASDALLLTMPTCQQLLVCGGGALNSQLMCDLKATLSNIDVTTTGATGGMDVMHVEALAFAWLAHAFKFRKPGNCLSVTGARGPRVLGAHYPA